MKSKQILEYIQGLKKEHNFEVSDILLEKDFILSNFLSTWKKEETPALDKLIFKGGTLLTKNYLDYHRISEDLDFTHYNSNEIRNLDSINKKERKIKELIIPIFEEIEKITRKSGLDFVNDRNNIRYVQVKNSRSIYVISMYYKSLVTNNEQYIKLEINFIENILNDIYKEEILNITDYYPLEELFLRVIDYNIKKNYLYVYPIKEIILEKIRATLTRKQFKPRDVFDLFLINKKIDIFEVNYEDIETKLNSSAFNHDTKDNIQKFLVSDLDFDISDIENLSLVEYDSEDFEEFKRRLFVFLKDIAKRYCVVATLS